MNMRVPRVMISCPRPVALSILVPLLGAEAAAASVVTFLASAIVAAYAADWCGLRIVPAAILIVSLAAAAVLFARLRPSRADE
jgi:hypothetical protein